MALSLNLITQQSHVNDSVRLRAGISNLTDESVSEELEYLGYVEEPRTYYVGMTADF
ncbi:TonB-dependent receptor [Vibrio coralliirubri]|uniref:TonB-dependent receptor n=2 Tax=Vibrio coralliirubri TaxID=1516159 RepID=UPI0021C291C8|nr:TonB-dependent receptor [Vibrio coralliirubri]